jgi:hypothetical protein
MIISFLSKTTRFEKSIKKFNLKLRKIASLWYGHILPKIGCKNQTSAKKKIPYSKY